MIVEAAIVHQPRAAESGYPESARSQSGLPASRAVQYGRCTVTSTRAPRIAKRICHGASVRAGNRSRPGNQCGCWLSVEVGRHGARDVIQHAPLLLTARLDHAEQRGEGDQPGTGLSGRNTGRKVRTGHFAAAGTGQPAGDVFADQKPQAYDTVWPSPVRFPSAERFRCP